MGNSDYPYFVYAKIWEPIQPLDRGERYEDPLQDALERAGWGEVSGGGSLMDEKLGVEYAGIDIELATLDALDLVKRVLEAAGAPKGSELQYEVEGESRTMPFGATEGLAIFLRTYTRRGRELATWTFALDAYPAFGSFWRGDA